MTTPSFRAVPFFALGFAALAACSDSPSTSSSGTTPVSENGADGGTSIDTSCTCNFSYNGDKRLVYCGQSTCYGTEEWACLKSGPSTKTPNAAACTKPVETACECSVTTGGKSGTVACGAKKCVGTSEVSCSSSKQSSISENASACTTKPPCTCTTNVGGQSKTLECGNDYCLSGNTKYTCPSGGGTVTQTANDPLCTPPDYTSRFTVDGVAVTCAETKFSPSLAIVIAEKCTGALGVNRVWVSLKQGAPRGTTTTNDCRLTATSNVRDRVSLFPNSDTSGSYDSGTDSTDACSVRWTKTNSTDDVRVEIVGATVRVAGTSKTKQITGGGLAEYIIGL